jgi:hypothetical protein
VSSISPGSAIVSLSTTLPVISSKSGLGVSSGVGNLPVSSEGNPTDISNTPSVISSAGNTVYSPVVTSSGNYFFIQKQLFLLFDIYATYHSLSSLFPCTMIFIS